MGIMKSSNVTETIDLRNENDLLKLLLVKSVAFHRSDRAHLSTCLCCDQSDVFND